MGTSITTAMPEPQMRAGGDGFTLSQLLSILVLDGSCFCCGGHTDLMLESKLTPAKGVALAMDGRYNPIDNNLTTANLALEYKGEGTNLASLGYRYSRSALEYLEGHFAFPVTSQLTANVLARYSFDKGGFLESRYSLEYKRQCWSIITSYSDRPGNRSFTVNFALAGIGPLVPVRAF